MMLKVDLKDLKKMERHLADFKSTAMPYACREYANSQAFEAQKLWKGELPGKMKLRTKWTEQSIQVEKTRSLNVNRMESVVGSRAEYMDEQEFGDVETKRGRHGVPLPAAAPGKRKTRGRLSKAKQFKMLKLMPSVSGHRSKQVMAAMNMAKKRGGPQHAFLQLRKGRAGIYKIDPSKKGKMAIRKVWDLSKSSVTVPANPTMQPAIRVLAPRSPLLWKKALEFQLRRHRLFGY